MTATVRKI